MKSSAKFTTSPEVMRKPSAVGALLCAMLLMFVGVLLDLEVALGQQWKDVLAKGQHEGLSQPARTR